MKFSAKLLSLTLIFVSSLSIFTLSLSLATKQSEKPMNFAITKSKNQNIPNLESDQSFSSAAGSIVEYNVYIENKGKSNAYYALSAWSENGFYIEVWQETDQIGNGDMQLVPPQDSVITVLGGEVATLVVKVAIPSDVVDGTLDYATIRALNVDSGTSNSVTVTTTVDSDLPYPTSWVQLGSDSSFPSPPERIDVKSLYYSNNGSDIFFRMAVPSSPDTKAFLYSVYMDIKSGGQQIENYGYDYLLSSEGVLYEWNGVDWVDSGYSAYITIEGTGLVLWSGLDSLIIENSELNFLACTSTKNGFIKDKLGPFVILKNNVSETPLLLIPILALTSIIILLKGFGKNFSKNKHTYC
jgi:hypothetical protein